MQKQEQTTKDTGEQPKDILGKFSKAAKSFARFSIFPRDGQFRYFLAASMLAAPTASLLFPSAEEYLEDKGYDKNIVEDLAGSDQFVRVREFNTAAFVAHSVVTKPNIFLLGMEAISNQARHGYARQANFDTSILRTINSVMYPVIGCEITVLKGGADLDEILEWGLTEDEALAFIVFHELAHCHPDNKNMSPYMREVDADYRAAEKLAEVFDKPELLTKLMYMRAAIKSEEGYNNAIYFDAKINGTELPTESEIRVANAYIESGIEDLCLVYNQDLPKTHQARIRLFLEALDYKAELREAAQQAVQEVFDAMPGQPSFPDLPQTPQHTEPTPQVQGAVKPVEEKVLRIVEHPRQCIQPSRPAPKKPGV